ncbi:putative reverse transcriptase domain-containing protein [Tanacetum coccineum]
MALGRRLTVRRNPPVNRSTNRNNVDINSGIDTQMFNKLIATRVAEALAAAAVTHATSTQEETNLGSNSSQNKAGNYKEFRAIMYENFHGTEGAVGLTRWFKKLESQFGISNVVEGDRVKFASSTLLDSALTWWNVYVRSVTLDIAHATPWSDFKVMFIRKYCPRNEVKQMENELWNLKGNVTSSKPVDLHEAIEMAQGLMYQVVQELGENSSDKQKWNRNHYNNNPNITSNLNPNKRLEIARVFTAGQVKDCRALPLPASESGPGSQGGQGSDVTCFGCGEKGHYKNKCPNNGGQGRGNQIRGNQQNPQNNQRQNQGNPKGNNQASTSTQGGRRAPGRVYSLCAEAAVKDNNVVNGTFLINNVYASVVFDIGADRSFVSYAFSKYIDIPPTTLDTNYSVELADGKSLTTNTILRGCTLNLQNHLFKIDLLPIELGSFDVFVRMDWMAEHRAEVLFIEVHSCPIEYKLIIQGERSGVKNKSRLEVISSIRTRIDFLEVFPKDFPGLPLTRQVEFHIERIPEAATCARAPYRLAPAEMKELAEQLKELSNKVIYKTKFLSEEHQTYLSKRKDGYFLMWPEKKIFPRLLSKHDTDTTSSKLYLLGLTTPCSKFMDLMNRVCKPYIDKFVIVFIDDIIIYSRDEKQHEEHLKTILELLKKEDLYAKFFKFEFWIHTVKFLGYVIDSSGIHVDPTKIELVKNWASPTTPSEIR